MGDSCATLNGITTFPLSGLSAPKDEKKKWKCICCQCKVKFIIYERIAAFKSLLIKSAKSTRSHI